MLAIVAAAVALALFAALTRGAWGAAMRAVRDSDDRRGVHRHRSVGASRPSRSRLSAALAGLAGGLFAPLSGFVTPSSFAFLQSILFVLVVMIGGAGSFAGPVVGAIIVGVLPELLASLEEYRLLFFGALLLVVLWVAPDGIVGLRAASVARWRDRERARGGADRTSDTARRRRRAASARRDRARARVAGLRCRSAACARCSDLAFDGAAGARSPA